MDEWNTILPTDIPRFGVLVRQSAVWHIGPKSTGRVHSGWDLVTIKATA